MHVCLCTMYGPGAQELDLGASVWVLAMELFLSPLEGCCK